MHLTTYDLDIFNDNTNSKKWDKKKWSIVQIVLVENIAMRMKLFCKILIVCTRFAFMVGYSLLNIYVILSMVGIRLNNLRYYKQNTHSWKAHISFFDVQMAKCHFNTKFLLKGHTISMTQSPVLVISFWLLSSHAVLRIRNNRCQESKQAL